MKKIQAIAEDKYGCSAINELIKKLREYGKIRNDILLDCHSVGGKGNIISTKTIRIIKSSRLKGVDRIVIFTDSNDDDPISLENRVKDMLRNNGEDIGKVCIIIFEPHIEVLLAPHETNPVDYLRTHERYQKSDLPKRIKNIDINEVSKLKCFQKILNILNDP